MNTDFLKWNGCHHSTSVHGIMIYTAVIAYGHFKPLSYRFSWKKKNDWTLLKNVVDFPLLSLSPNYSMGQFNSNMPEICPAHFANIVCYQFSNLTRSLLETEVCPKNRSTKLEGEQRNKERGVATLSFLLLWTVRSSHHFWRKLLLVSTQQFHTMPTLSRILKLRIFCNRWKDNVNGKT